MIERWMPIKLENLEGNSYGIYRDGTVVNLDIPMVMHPYMRRGEMVVSLTGYNHKITMCVAKLIAIVFIPKTKDDIEKKRDNVILKNPDKKLHSTNIKWVSTYEKKLINELREKENKSKLDYVIPVCKLLEKGYNPKEICEVLEFEDLLYIWNMKNRRIQKKISKKYKF